jgi:hypothetical protein
LDVGYVYHSKNGRKKSIILLGGPWGRGRLFPSQESDVPTSNSIGLYPWLSPRRNLCGRQFGCRYDLPTQFDTWNHSEAIWHCTPVNWPLRLGEIVDNAGS